MIKHQNIETYISSFPQEIQILLNEIWNTVKKSAPDAIECISYGMPCFKTNGKPLVYFAAFSKHIGFYATPSGHQAFSKELSLYKQGKGSVQFPINKEIPLNLISEIVKFRVLENKNLTSKKETASD